VETLVAQHEAMLAAIEDRQPDRAEAATREHLREILKSLPKIAEANPELFVA
jgi:DNA-binding GntR family transcriptional regulator